MLFRWYIFTFILFFSILSHAASQDPLPSWHAGEIKQNIIHFVKAVTTKDSADYVPPENRIATIDNDGTLWVEQPIYPQVIFMIDRLQTLAKSHPEWKKIEPYKSLLNRQYGKVNSANYDLLFAKTSGGVTAEHYNSLAKDWLETAKDTRYKRHYNELIYQPMLEVMSYLRANGFTVYIVSGGGQDFIRSFATNTYGVHPEQVIGSSTETKYVDGEAPNLIKQSKLLLVSDKEGKAEAIHLFIGKKPIIAFGNSDGDRQMLEWTQSNHGRTLMLLVHHDDAEREYSYGAKSKVGTFSESLMQEARENRWQVISMKNDWKTIFPFELRN